MKYTVSSLYKFNRILYSVLEGSVYTKPYSAIWECLITLSRQYLKFLLFQKHEISLRQRHNQTQKISSATTNFKISAVTRPLSPKVDINVHIFAGSRIGNYIFFSFCTVLCSSILHYVLFPVLRLLRTQYYYPST